MTQGNGQASLFRVAASKADITPQTPLPLARLYDPHLPAKHVFDRMEANAVALRFGEAVAVFLSFDLLYVSTDLREAIAARVADLVPSERLFVSASHTHFAPSTNRLLPKLGPVSESYMAFLADIGAAQVKDVLGQLGVSATLHYVTGPSEHSINRRLRVFGLGRDFPMFKIRWEMRPNPAGPRDDIIRLLRITREDGAVVAVCWEYCCHPTNFPRKDGISADYPGVVRRALREAHGDVPVVFWQGFSGDVRPRVIRPERAGLFGLKSRPAFDQFTEAGWAAWSGTLAERVVEVSKSEGRALSGAITCLRGAVPIETLGPADGRAITFQEIALGADFSVFGISAEVSSGYVAALARSRAPADVIPVGCIDGVPGYLPTSEMSQQGGYEVSGFMKCFGIKGRYRADVTDTVERLMFARRAAG